MEIKKIVRGIILVFLQYFLIFVGIAMNEAGYNSLSLIFLCSSFLAGFACIFILFIYPFMLKNELEKDIQTIEDVASAIKESNKQNTE